MNPVLALIIANVIWGMASPIFKFALTNIPPFTLAFIRFFFAGLIFLPLAIKNWQELKFIQWLKIFLVGFFGITINVSFFFMGVIKTESINVPIIASSGPVFIYFLSMIFLKEKPKSKVLIGMLIALIGVLTIIFSPVFLEGRKIIIGAIEGNLFILIATFGSVFSILIGRDILKRVNVLQVSAISFLFSSITFLPFVSRELIFWNFHSLNFVGWTGIIFGVFFSSALAYYLFYYGVSRLHAQDVGIFTYIDPLAAIIVAAPLLHEYPNIFYIFGGLLIFGGIYFAERRIHWHPFHRLRKNS